MKMTTLALMAGMFISACTENQDSENPNWDDKYLDNPTTIEWENQTHDFGYVATDEVVTHEFKFTNTGENPLVLKSVKPSCGCTVPDKWPQDPIAPGGTGEIQVVFTGKASGGGSSVKVVANTDPSEHRLSIRASNSKEPEKKKEETGAEMPAPMAKDSLPVNDTTNNDK